MRGFFPLVRREGRILRVYKLLNADLWKNAVFRWVPQINMTAILWIPVLEWNPYICNLTLHLNHINMKVLKKHEDTTIMKKLTYASVSHLNNTGQQKKYFFFQNALEIYKYSAAEWCPEHDVAFRFSPNQTVFPWLYVEISKIADFRGQTFFYTGPK